MDINTSRMSIQSKIVKSNLGKLRIPDLHEMVRFTYMKFHISYTFLAPGKISEKKNYGHNSVLGRDGSQNRYPRHILAPLVHLISEIAHETCRFFSWDVYGANTTGNTAPRANMFIREHPFSLPELPNQVSVGG